MSGEEATPANPDRGCEGAEVIAAARRLAPRIIAAGDEAERLRQIPQFISDALAEAGLYRLYLPGYLGGHELPPAAAFRAIEEVSKADGSAGWCLMNANGMSLGAAWLDPDVTRAMFGPAPDIRIAGSLRPQGRAWRVDGGYRVAGRWNFASGLHNANWLYCACMVMQGTQAAQMPNGTPVTRTMWIPAATARFVDTWSVVGMRATGSHDFVLDDVFVPEAHTIQVQEQPRYQGLLYRPRIFLCLIHVLFAATGLGIARGAIDALVDLASREASSFSTVLLRDRPAVQAQLAQAEAMVSAARCYVLHSLDRLWAAVCADDPDPGQLLGQVRLAIPHAMHEAVRAADLVFSAAGTNAIQTGHPIERKLRDLRVAAQHNAAFPVHYESAGKVLLGLRPTEPGW